MQRLAFILRVIFAASVVATTAIGDEENPLRIVNPLARGDMAELHQPELRRQLEVEATETPEESTPVVSPKSQVEATAESTETNKIVELQAIIKDSEALNDEQRTSLSAKLEKAASELTVAKDTRSEIAELQEEIASLPAKIEKVHAALRRPDPHLDANAVKHATIDQLSKRVDALASTLSKKREATKQRQQRAEDILESRRSSQKRRDELKKERQVVEQELSDEADKGESELEQLVERAELDARLTKIKADEELLSVKVRLAKSLTELHPLQNDVDRREIARLEMEEVAWQQELATKRREESKRKAQAAQEKAASADVALAPLAQENARLAELRWKYSSRMAQVNAELRRYDKAFQSQEKEFQDIKDKVDKNGMTEAIGRLLRSHELIDLRPTLTRAKEVKLELPEVELLLMQYSEQRDAMWNTDALANRLVDQLKTRHPEATAKILVRDVLSAHYQHLMDLTTDLQEYQIRLTDLDLLLAKTARDTNHHRRYIDEHVLWIRSADLVKMKDIKKSKEGLARIFEPKRWRNVLYDVGGQLQQHLLTWLLVLVVIVVAMVIGDRLKDRITDVGKSKPVTSVYRFLPTVEVALETLALAAYLPIGMFLLSGYLMSFDGASSLEQSIGVGLRWASVMWLGLSLLHQTTRRGGLAESHFHWDGKNVKVVRKNVGLLMVLGLPAVVAVMVMESFSEGDYVDSLGRISFMAGMLVMAMLTHRLLDPYRRGNGVWNNPEVWLYRIRHFIHAICVVIPLSLTALAGWGYVFSAHQLAFRAQQTLWLVLAVVLVQAMVGRYLTVARRNAATRHMHRKRAAEQAESEVAVEDEIDFASIAGQVRRLLRGGTVVAILVGVVVIWADMVPALKMLDRVHLWAHNVVDADGTSQMKWVTLGDLLLSLAAVVGTIMAARNVPGLMNITVFERLPIDYGTRYALTAVSRYVISLFGIALAFNCIGVTWQSVQWLIAAMTVGLGFGLQEIFANFVSGLIIFTERPVRVGDVVTVGGVTGKVSRVQIRATTIMDFDRRELIVPNRKFITENVVNWTLSDPITRVVLPVGISYSCDPEEASKQLLAVAKAHPLVLQEPEPSSVFIGFGDSTLDMELRVFIIGRDHVFQVQNEINLAINRAFSEANIEISYPQRDLHIRSVESAALAESIKPARAA